MRTVATVVCGVCRGPATPSIFYRQISWEGGLQGRLAGIDDTNKRFRQEIMPELDAAYSFARYLSRDADAAQDIVQDALLRAYRGFHGDQGRSVRVWLFANVRNCYHDWLIRRRRTAKVEIDRLVNSKKVSIDDIHSGELSPEAAQVCKTELKNVRDAINTLPRPLREMIVLRELEGLSYCHIAEVATLPIGTVMSRLARARKKLAEIYRRKSP
jgi:RNA polymerase sigma factor (sigma-70 family)